MTLYPQLIIDALSKVRYPGTKKSIVESEMLEDDIRIDGMNVSFSLIFEKSTDPFLRILSLFVITKDLSHPDRWYSCAEQDAMTDTVLPLPVLSKSSKYSSDMIICG